MFLRSLDELDSAGAKLEGLKKLAGAGLPTPSMLVLEHKAFLEHKSNGFSHLLKKELEGAWCQLTDDGGVLTVRAAFEQAGVPILVKSQTNLPSFEDMLFAIENAWQQALALGAGEDAKLQLILQRFFESEKMGHLHTSYTKDASLIEVLPGQVVYAMTRGEMTPDSYVVDKKNMSVTSKHISRKQAKMVKTDVGLKEVATTPQEATAETLSVSEIQKIVKFGIQMESRHGPQELEFAVTPDNTLIFFDSRNSEMLSTQDGFCVCGGRAKGTLKRVSDLENLSSVTPEHVVVLQRPSIDLVTFLALKHPPAGVVLVGASPSSHAATILREAKLPAVSLKKLEIPEGTVVELDGGTLSPETDNIIGNKSQLPNRN